MARKRMELKDAEDAYNFFESRKAKTGETFSEIIDKLVIQYQGQSDDFITNFEILNYILMTD